MSISSGDGLPAATLFEIGPEGARIVETGALTAGRTVVIFAVPGPYTSTCHNLHLPSFIRVMDRLRAKGVDDVVCVAAGVDAFVMNGWGESAGALKAGIRMMADPKGEFAEALGLRFDIPALGLFDRMRRHALLVRDGVVAEVMIEEGRGTCDMSGGEAMLAVL